MFLNSITLHFVSFNNDFFCLIFTGTFKGEGLIHTSGPSADKHGAQLTSDDITPVGTFKGGNNHTVAKPAAVTPPQQTVGNLSPAQNEDNKGINNDETITTSSGHILGSGTTIGDIHTKFSKNEGSKVPEGCHGKEIGSKRFGCLHPSDLESHQKTAPAEEEGIYSGLSTGGVVTTSGKVISGEAVKQKNGKVGKTTFGNSNKVGGGGGIGVVGDQKLNTDIIVDGQMDAGEEKPGKGGENILGGEDEETPGVDSAGPGVNDESAGVIVGGKIAPHSKKLVADIGGRRNTSVYNPLPAVAPAVAPAAKPKPNTAVNPSGRCVICENADARTRSRGIVLFDWLDYFSCIVGSLRNNPITLLPKRKRRLYYFLIRF